MNLDAAIFMFCAWGFTLGLLIYCIVMLVKHPQANSVLPDNQNKPGDDLDKEL